MSHWMMQQPTEVSSADTAATAAETSEPSGFRLTRTNQVLLVATFLVATPVSLLVDSDQELSFGLNVSGAIGGTAVAVLILWGLGWFAYLVTGCRRGAGNIAVSVLCGFAILGAFGRLGKVNERAERRRNFDQAVATTGQDIRTQIRDNGYAEPSTVTPLLDAYDAIAAEESGPDAKIAAASAQLMREVLQQRAKYDAALEPLIDSGGFDPATLSTVEAIEERVAVVQRLAVENDRLDVCVQGIEGRMRQLLREQKLSEGLIEASVRGMMRSMRPDLQRQVRESDRQMCAAGEALLILLRENWGNWHFDGEFTRFDDPAVGVRFNALADQIDAAAAVQAAIQEALVAQLGG